MFGKLIDLARLASVGGYMYKDAHYFAMRVSIDPHRARAWLPAGVSLTNPPTATVFVAQFPWTSFGSTYEEAGILLHVRRRLRRAVFCPWMVVNDDVALVFGRDILGYPKKMARIDITREGDSFTAEAERRGTVIMQVRAKLGPVVHDAPPMLGQRALNVRGAPGSRSQRFVSFTPRERIVEVRSATAELSVSSAKPVNEVSAVVRDNLESLGIGTVQRAHLYRVDIGAWRLPSEGGRVSTSFALRSLGARFL